jgi:hypothetical protein
MVALVAFSLSGAVACHAASAVLQWEPVADARVTGYKVYYQADSAAQPFQGTGATQGASPIDVHTATSATISGLASGHLYFFAVTAYNATGQESVYSDIVSAFDTIAPSVSISSPASNATVAGTVSVTATASDNVAVTSVEFYVNSVLQFTDSGAPHMFSWNTTSLAPGTYSLMAKAYDAAGNSGTSGSVAVKVIKDTTVPTVSLTAPANNATVSGTVTITAGASDNIGLS